MLKIGVPSKGRLMENTFDWFGARGLAMRQTGDAREYAGAVEGMAGVELVLLSAGEIPRELASGRIHLGVTGSDLLRDKLADWQAQVEELALMGFGHADLILAVPNVWIDVTSLDDLDAAAASFRRAHGFRLRIATKYHRLVREYLTDHGVADYQLVDSQGATEGTVKNLTAEAIADITSDPLPSADLMMVRDCLVHLQFDMRWAFFENFVASGITYLLITSWIRPDNRWVYKNGGEKSFNMMATPFGFPAPERFILETADVLPEGEAENPETMHRGMGLWHRDAIAARVAEWQSGGRVITRPA